MGRHHHSLLQIISFFPSHHNKNYKNNMTKLTKNDMTPLNYWTGRALATRDFGHTYVHAAWRTDDYVHGDIVFTWSGWGRSLLSGGHKYKVHARYIATGEPVPTKVLKSL